jgi:hypothetical protein
MIALSTQGLVSIRLKRNCKNTSFPPKAGNRAKEVESGPRRSLTEPPYSAVVVVGPAMVRRTGDDKNRNAGSDKGPRSSTNGLGRGRGRFGSP